MRHLHQGFGLAVRASASVEDADAELPVGGVIAALRAAAHGGGVLVAEEVAPDVSVGRVVLRPVTHDHALSVETAGRGDVVSGGSPSLPNQARKGWGARVFLGRVSVSRDHLYAFLWFDRPMPVPTPRDQFLDTSAMVCERQRARGTLKGSESSNQQRDLGTDERRGNTGDCFGSARVGLKRWGERIRRSVLELRNGVCGRGGKKFYMGTPNAFFVGHG